MAKPRLGILGGSGLYEMAGLADVEWRDVASPFGKPSDQLCFGRLGEAELVFLPRHGRGHPLSPSDINYRANIDALKRSGVGSIVSLSAVGGLQEATAPGTFVLVDQFIDRTTSRQSSFFGAGCVAHVSMGHPVCRRVMNTLAQAGQDSGVAPIVGGTYMVMEGPAFSTRAESELYRNWGCSVIGMTNLPEAKLAREAEICYATVAMVTDYDCWHPDHDHVTVEMVVRVLTQNADRAKALVRAAIPLLAAHEGACEAGCDHALDHAIITAPAARNPAKLAELDAVAGRVLGRG